MNGIVAIDVAKADVSVVVQLRSSPWMAPVPVED